MAIALSAGAQLLVKASVTGADGDLGEVAHALRSPLVIAGVVCYALAFVVYAYVLSIYDITLASPLMVAGVMLLVFLGGAVSGEAITLQRTAGVLLLLGAVILISRSA